MREIGEALLATAALGLALAGVFYLTFRVALAVCSRACERWQR